MILVRIPSAAFELVWRDLQATMRWPDRLPYESQEEYLERIGRRPQQIELVDSNVTVRLMPGCTSISEVDG